MPTLEFKDPADVLNAAFAALNLDDWAGFAELFDPVSLRAFKSDMLASYDDDVEEYHIDADDLLEFEPDMPREAAEYKAARMNEVTSKAHRLKREFLIVESVDELRAMDPARMFVLSLQACSPHRQAEHEPPVELEPWEEASDWDESYDDGKKATRAYRYSVVGCIYDGPEIAHVLYRHDLTADKIFPEEYAEVMSEKPEDEQLLCQQLHHKADLNLMTCRRQRDGSWRLIATQTLFLVSSLQRV